MGVHLHDLAITPRWVKVTKSHTEFQTAGVTNDIEIYSLPSKAEVHQVIVKHSTAFAGTTTYTLSIGITGNLTKYLAASNMKAAVAATTFYSAYTVNTIETFGAATSIRAAAVATVENLDQSSAGSVDIWLLVSQLG